MRAPRALSRQFAEPSGLLGAWVGRVMARVNATLTREAIDRLGLSGGERVLEVGFGPGVGIATLAERLPSGKVCGIDLSEVMAHQARARARAHSDRVDLRVGSVTALPWPEGSFDAVCTTNSAQFWEPLEGSAREVRRVLEDGGRVSIALHEMGIALAQRERGADPAGGPEPVIAQMERVLRSAGFTQVQTERRQVRGGTAFYLTAVAQRS
jgi:SAM-dependent methyltransferase